MHVHVVSDYEGILCHVRWFFCCWSYFLTFIQEAEPGYNVMLVCVRAQFHIPVVWCSTNVIKFQNQIVHLCWLRLSFQRQLKIITMICVMQIYILPNYN